MNEALAVMVRGYNSSGLSTEKQLTESLKAKINLKTLPEIYSNYSNQSNEKLNKGPGSTSRE